MQAGCDVDLFRVLILAFSIPGIIREPCYISSIAGINKLEGFRIHNCGKLVVAITLSEYLFPGFPREKEASGRGQDQRTRRPEYQCLLRQRLPQCTLLAYETNSQYLKTGAPPINMSLGMKLVAKAPKPKLPCLISMFCAKRQKQKCYGRGRHSGYSAR